MRKLCKINLPALLLVLLWMCVSLDVNAKITRNGDGFFSVQTTNATASIDVLPYTEGFDDATTLPTGWTTVGLSTASVVTNESYKTANAVRLGNGYSFLVAPILSESADATNLLSVKYALKVSSENIIFEVGVMTDAADPTTFVPLDKPYISSTNWSEQIALLNNYTGEGRYIAFKVQNNQIAYIDDITIDVAEECTYVGKNMRASNVVETSAKIIWDNILGLDISMQNRVLEYKKSTDDTWTTIFLTSETSYVLTGLSDETNYTVRLYGSCYGFILTDTLTTSFTTVKRFCEGVTIGNGAVGNNYAPINTNVANSYTQSIFLKSDIGGARTITGIAFSHNHATSCTRKVAIYFVHTNASAYSSASPIKNVNSEVPFVKVFEGNVTFTNGENNSIPISFDIPFNYNGTDNVAITMISSGATANNSNRFQGTNKSGVTRTIYGSRNSEYSTEDPAGSFYNCASGWQYNTIFMLSCEGIDECYAPTALTASDITTDEATISWINLNATPSNFEFAYKRSSSSNWTTVSKQNETTHLLTNLNANTTYDIRVRAICSLTDTAEWRTSSFTTKAVPCAATISIPFYTNFDSYSDSQFPNCWKHLTIGNNNNSALTTTESNTLTYPTALNFNNTNLSYNITALAAIHDNFEMSDLQVSFSAKKGNATIGTFILGVMEDSDDMGSFEPVETINFTNTDWTHFNVSLENYTGYGRHIAFKWEKGNTSLYLDELHITTQQTCKRPLTLKVDSLSNGRDLYVSWTDDDENTTWLCAIVKSGTTVNWDNAIETNDKNIKLYSSPNTKSTIYVKAKCDDEVTSLPIGISYKNTTCGIITLKDLPYTENFDDKTVGIVTRLLPDCNWTRITSGMYPALSERSGTPRSAPNLLHFYPNTPTDNGMVIFGPFNGEEIKIEKLCMKFDFQTTNTSIGLQIGAVKDITNPYELPEVTKVMHTASETGWKTHQIQFGNYAISIEGEDYYISFTASGEASNANMYMDNLVVYLAEECSEPINVRTTNTNTTDVTLNWNSSSNAEQWTVKYGETGFNPEEEGTEIAGVTKPYILSGLAANTSYDVYIKSYCGENGESNWSNVYTFKTATPMATVPYETSFEDADNTNWTFINGNQPNKWHIGTAASKDGGNGLYISNDGGNTNAYKYDATSYTYATRLFTFDNVGSYGIEFDWKAVGDASNDLLRVFLVPASIDIVAGNAYGMTNTNNITPPDWIDIAGGVLNRSSSWRHVNNDFSIATPGNYNIVFFWKNNNTVEYPSPAAIDNVKVVELSCAKPTNLAVNAIRSTTATVSWTQLTTGVLSWEVEYGPKGFARGTGTLETATGVPSHNLTDLTPSSYIDVYVRAMCGEGDNSVWTSAFTFDTECEDITQLPFTENFDGTNATVDNSSLKLLCWHGYAEHFSSSNYPRISNTTSYNPPSGTNFLALGQSSPVVNYTLVVLPKIADEIAINELEISLKVNYRAGGENSVNRLDIGIMDSPTAYATFIPITAINPNDQMPNDWQDFTVNLLRYEGAGKYIAFKRTGNTGEFSLDDIVVSRNNNICESPSAPIVGNVTTTTAEISWTAGPDETSWFIEYKPQASSEAAFQTYTTNTTSYRLTGLTDGTLYEVRLRTACSKFNAQHAFFQTEDSLVTITPSAGADGIISPSTPIQIKRGQNYTFAFAPDNGYEVSGIYVNNSLVTTGILNPTAVRTEYFEVENVQRNTTIEVRFRTRDASNLVTVQGIVSNTNHGTISPNNLQRVAKGTNVEYVITPNMGCEVVDVLVNNVSVGAVTSHTVSSVQVNTIVCAVFKADTVTMTATAGKYGTISPTGTILVEKLTNKTFVFNPSNGYTVDQVTVNGENKGILPFYTFTNIQNDNTIDVTFRSIIETFVITATAGANGSISPSGEVIVNVGQSQTFNFIPDTDYEVDEVTVNAENKGRIPSYTFTNVSADATINVTFRPVTAVVDTFVITATAGANGSITPSGEIKVAEGQSQAFTFTPATEFKVANVLVDGVVVDSNVTSHTIYNVTANMTIRVEFIENIGINQHILDNSVVIYPNPAQDKLKVKMDMPFDNVEITNLLGQVIYTTAILDAQELEIDVVSYRPGVYMIRLQSEQGIVVKKFIKE